MIITTKHLPVTNINIDHCLFDQNQPSLVQSASSLVLDNSFTYFSSILNPYYLPHNTIINQAPGKDISLEQIIYYMLNINKATQSIKTCFHILGPDQHKNQSGSLNIVNFTFAHHIYPFARKQMVNVGKYYME